jgi:hypothetical protein
MKKFLLFIEEEKKKSMEELEVQKELLYKQYAQHTSGHASLASSASGSLQQSPSVGANVSPSALASQKQPVTNSATTTTSSSTTTNTAGYLLG